MPSGLSKLKAQFDKKHFPRLKGYVEGAAELRVTVFAFEFFAFNPLSNQDVK